MKEIATAALINMSINEQAKLALAYVPGAVDTVIRTIGDSQSKELKSVAAGLLYSLIINDELKTIICLKDSLWDSVIGLLKETSGKCKSEALKLLFVLAKDERWRNKLMQEDNELISLLISLLTAGMPKLTEDCLTVISLLARSGAGTKAILDDKSSIPIFVYLLNSGSPRAQENAASVLNNICQQDGNVKEILPLQTLIPALNSLMRGGSDRGKFKAASLLRVLDSDTAPSLSTASNLSDAEADLYPEMSSELRSAESVPVMPTYADAESSSVLQVPQSLNTVSTPSSEP
ncbi:hypothetical protein KP509_35G034600 [Ceratopteris richardii]|nr:hypothetical protein KP509_35G034600 [Ceratopteris richardii]